MVCRVHKKVVQEGNQSLLLHREIIESNLRADCQDILDVGTLPLHGQMVKQSLLGLSPLIHIHESHIKFELMFIEQVSERLHA